MNDRTLHPQESLALISDMISLSRKHVNQNGFYLILWGIVLVISFVATYLHAKITLPFNLNYVWIAALVIGMGGSFWYGYKTGKQKTTFNHLDRIYVSIWIGFMVSWVLTIIFGSNIQFEGIFINLFAANAVLMSGVVIRFKPLIIGSVFMYLASGILLYLSPDLPQEYLLIQAGSLVAGYIIPGLMLSRYVAHTKQA